MITADGQGAAGGAARGELDDWLHEAAGAINAPAVHIVDALEMIHIAAVKQSAGNFASVSDQMMEKAEELRPVEINKFTVLLVFAPVFGVAPKVTYSNTLPLARLEDQHKSGAIQTDLFISTDLKRMASELNGIVYGFNG